MIQNSAHDSICGCSADEVSAQVLVRYAEAEQIGRELARRAVDASPRTPRGTRRRREPVAARAHRPRRARSRRARRTGARSAWRRADGDVLPTQELHRQQPLLWEGPLTGIESVRRRIHGRELFGRVLNGFRIDDSTVTLEVGDEPDPEWLDVEQLDPGDRARDRRGGLGAADRRPPAPYAARAGDRAPARLAVPPPGRGRPAGRRSARSRRRREGLTRIVRGRDEGDSYNYAPPEDDVLVVEPAEQRLEQVETGPLRAVAVLHRTYEWDGRPVATATRFERRAGEPLVRIRVDFDNPCENQRVRVHLPLRERADGSRAEGQFAVVERGLEPEGGYGEVPWRRIRRRFVAAGRTALLLDHVTEYEVVDGSELALTMLRSTGLISRSDNRYREDPAGPEMPIPAAQLRGPWSFSFAWCLDGADPLELLDAYRLPFLVGRGSGGDSRSGPGTELRGASLSALRRRDGRLEARVVNLGDEPRECTFDRPGPRCARGRSRRSRSERRLARWGRRRWRQRATTVAAERAAREQDQRHDENPLGPELTVRTAHEPDQDRDCVRRRRTAAPASATGGRAGSRKDGAPTAAGAARARADSRCAPRAARRGGSGTPPASAGRPRNRSATHRRPASGRGRKREDQAPPRAHLPAATPERRSLARSSRPLAEAARRREHVVGLERRQLRPLELLQLDAATPASRSACAFSACSNSVRAKRALPKPSPRAAPSRIRRSASSAPSSSTYSFSAAKLLRDREQLVRRVVGERDLAREARAQARVRVEEALHQPRVARDDHDEAVAVVLHPLEQRLDRLGPEVLAARPPARARTPRR